MKLNLSIFMFFVLWINQISAQPEILEKNISEAFGNIVGGIVFIDADNKKISYNETLIEEKFPPCSTFKIWNALIGLEYGIITSPDEKFYTWDGVTRSIPDWNKNLILREAFKVSCVPAFQNLARKIGNKSMQKWIDSINYGDRDISSGIDDFWLPRKDKKSILISAKEQVKLNKTGDELNIRIGNHRRNLVLPQALAALNPSGAKMEDDYLKIKFANMNK